MIASRAAATVAGAASTAAAAAAVPQNSTPAALAVGRFFRVQLKRSRIGLTVAQKTNLDALGLGKRMSISYVPVRPDFAGRIFKAKELVAIEEVSHVPPYHRERIPCGYSVIGSYLPSKA